MKRGKPTRSVSEDLPPLPVLLRLLVLVALALAPFLPILPAWVTLTTLAALLWRAAAAWHRWRLPGIWLRAGLATATFAGIYASFGRIDGLVAGASLLTAATALKLAELRSLRDLRILAAVLYFILVVHFLFSQALWTIVYLLACTWLITASLIESSHPAVRIPPRTSLRLSATMTAQALPLMLVLFILFPRIPGPLWGLPADSGALRAGLADSMAPGDIRRMVLSDAVAFRVHFDGPAPPRDERYWRGPVFSFYDGHRWRPGITSPAAPVLRLRGMPVDYRITLEPNRNRWLFALDMPDPAVLPPDARFDGDAVLESERENRDRRQYALRSYPRYQLQLRLGARERRQDLSLPRHLDPATRALAHRWRAEGLDDAGVIAAALRMFRTQDFHYTLQPPPLGTNAIDDFLFHTRAGFCEHYAGSFTFLMRAAGIPARVVTGYQGGSRNTYGDYYVVRDDDAHAWSEVWLTGRGWVRVDPTAAVSPARIDDGIDAALAGVPGLPAFLRPQWQYTWRHALQARWDWLDTQWNRWVLGYGPDLQQRLMGTLGLVNWRDMILALTAAVTLILSAIALTVLRQARPAPTIDPARRLWIRATRDLHRLGLVQNPSEGSQPFCERVCRQEPALSPWMHRLCATYQVARYLDPSAADALAELRRAARPPPRRCLRPTD